MSSTSDKPASRLKTDPGARSTSLPVLLENSVWQRAALSLAEVVGVTAAVQRLNSYILKTKDVGVTSHDLSPPLTAGTLVPVSAEHAAA